jgi:hypothetical protein
MARATNCSTKALTLSGPVPRWAPPRAFITPAQPSEAQLVEAGLGDAELPGSRSRVEVAIIEHGENAADELGREAVEKLLHFIPASCTTPPQ